MSEAVCEICENLLSCDTHHIHSLSKGGKDSKGNKCKICPNCHRKVHNGDIIIEGKFMTSAGFKSIWRNKNEKSITGLHDPKVWINGKK